MKLVGSRLVGFGAVPCLGAFLWGMVSQTQVVAAQCPLSHGYWETHPEAWPRQFLLLGNVANPAHTYTQSELLNLLRTPTRGDASVVLAYQLIAAKLNIASGSSFEPIAATVTNADALLGSFPGRLPYRVAAASATGQAMVAAAGILENYNTGRVANSCQVAFAGEMVHLNGAGSTKERF